GYVDRDRHLGGGRRARHAGRPGGRRRAGQLRQKLLHSAVPRVLALRARPHLHPRHAVPAAGADGAVSKRRPMSAAAVAANEGGAFSHVASRGLDATHGVVLYLEDISVCFDGFQALSKLSLSIDVGELRCVIGPNGAGKTTMMDVITGKTRPDSGTAFFGQTIDLTRLSEAEISHAGIGRKFQKP